MNKIDVNLCIKYIFFDRKIYISCGWKKIIGILLKLFLDLCGKFLVKDMSFCIIILIKIFRCEVLVEGFK